MFYFKENNLHYHKIYNCYLVIMWNALKNILDVKIQIELPC